MQPWWAWENFERCKIINYLNLINLHHTLCVRFNVLQIQKKIYLQLYIRLLIAYSFHMQTMKKKVVEKDTSQGRYFTW